MRVSLFLVVTFAISLALPGLAEPVAEGGVPPPALLEGEEGAPAPSLPEAERTSPAASRGDAFPPGIATAACGAAGASLGGLSCVLCGLTGLSGFAWPLLVIAAPVALAAGQCGGVAIDIAGVSLARGFSDDEEAREAALTPSLLLPLSFGVVVALGAGVIAVPSGVGGAIAGAQLLENSGGTVFGPGVPTPEGIAAMGMGAGVAVFAVGMLGTLVQTAVTTSYALLSRPSAPEAAGTVEEPAATRGAAVAF